MVKVLGRLENSEDAKDCSRRHGIRAAWNPRNRNRVEREHCENIDVLALPVEGSDAEPMRVERSWRSECLHRKAGNVSCRRKIARAGLEASRRMNTVRHGSIPTKRDCLRDHRIVDGFPGYLCADRRGCFSDLRLLDQ